MLLSARPAARPVAVALAVAGLLLAPSSGPAAAATAAAPAAAGAATVATPAAAPVTDLQIAKVAKVRWGRGLAVTVRYRCAPGMLNEVVGAYDARSSFDWVEENELIGQEESRVFDVPCTGRYETTTLKLVTTGRLPRRVHVVAGIGVSDPTDWSFEVANDTGRFRI